MSYSIRMTAPERDMAMNYAKFRGITLSQAFKEALFEKIEDELDLRVIAEYEADKVEGKVQTRPLEELWAELGLENV